MDEEVKKRRKEREQQAVEQRLAEERRRKMEQDNKHLLANLFSQKPMHNQSLAQSLAQSQILKQKLNQNIQTGSLAQQLQRIQAQPGLQQNSALLTLQRNANHTLQRPPNSWPKNSSTPTSNHAPLSNMPSISPQFYSQSFLPSFSHLKSSPLSLLKSTLPPRVSSKNPLDEILDLTVGSPSPSPDTTEGGLNLDSLTRHSAGFEDDFNLESLISQSSSNTQQTAQIQAPLLLQQQPQQQQRLLQATQQQSHNLVTNSQDFLDFLDLPLSPQMPTQKASPSSSTSSCSSSTSSTSAVSNNQVSHTSTGLRPTSALLPTSPSSSLFSSPSSSSSLFSNSSCFSSPYLLPQSDSISLPNGHCSSAALDVREALNSMLQAGPDRKSVIQYRQQD